MNKWGIVFGKTPSNPVNPLNIELIKISLKPLEAFSKIQQHCKNAYLLESIEGPQKLAQYSFIGFNPKTTIQVVDGKVKIIDNQTQKTTIEKTNDPLSLIQKILQKEPLKNTSFRFIGGAVGYISYDAARYWENLPKKHKNDSFPDVEMGIFDDGLIFNHVEEQAFYYYRSENRLLEIEKILQQPSEPLSLSFAQPKVETKKEQYERAVEKAKTYVNEGDIFQVVLSKRFEFKFQGSLIPFYEALRAINPSPYMYYLKFGDHQIIGSSPEMLIRVDNRMVETFPIAGTKPIAQTIAENTRLASELLADPKERAEHVMLVDLARNDLGRISKYGSISVPEFMKVHQYSHVQHIVSQVVGELRDELQSYDAVRAVFPAGTVSGAPKVRAMEIIDELESTRRGPYAGAVGYFSYNGNADFAITIRTLFADKNQAYLQAGAGIVADSVPEREWMETDHKAEALIRALEIAANKKPLKVLVIDNYDSFVYNLVQYIGEQGAQTIVYRNDKVTLEEVVKLKPDRIVISPGPGTPEDEKYFGVCTAILRTVSPSIPTLGVCLGHQGIIHAYGGKIIHAKKLMHGKTCTIRHNQKNLFKDVHQPFTATRYHSLAGARESIPECLEITAEASDDGEIMGIRHVKYPIYGVQFHPESILCEDGKIIIKNFLEGKP
jgi:anthranilate synthase component 1